MPAEPEALMVGYGPEARPDDLAPLPADPWIFAGEKKMQYALRPLSTLLRGSGAPPAFERTPPPQYLNFLLVIERCASLAGAKSRRPPPDAEYERLYRHLRRRPDGTEKHPLFSWLQRGAQLYASLRETSAAELDAVLERLQRSARTFSQHVGSTNYYELALKPLVRVEP